MADLLITLADGSTRTLRLTDRPVLLGRDPSCTLAFPADPELSRRHLSFEPDGDGWAVRDLNSTNGTRLNGEPLTGARRLKSGDRIAASQITLVWMESQPPSRQTVVFETSQFDQSPGTVAIHLADLLGAAPAARPSQVGKVWVTPLQALLRVGRELAGRRPLEELFGVILDLALEAVGAERGVLMTMEGGELLERASRGGEFRISTAVRDRVINGRESLLIESVADTPALLASKTIMLQGVRSLLAVPLQTDERVIGLLYLDARNYLRRFTNDDLNLLTVMANVAAIRIEQQRLHEIEETQRRHQAELAQAAEIQKRHLPRKPPLWDGLELAAVHAACLTVGGDYHDFFRYADGRYGAIVADVAGKGMPAALMMMSLQARVQALSETVCSMADFVARLNRNMIPSCAPNKFVTLFVCAYDPASGELRYTNAGHLPGLIIRSSGLVEKLEAGGMFAGLLPDLAYDEGAAALGMDDLLLLYSDGITEQENPQGEEFGVDRLAALASECRQWPLDDLAAHIQDAVTVFSASQPIADDQTIVLMRRRPLTGSEATRR